MAGCVVWGVVQPGDGTVYVGSYREANAVADGILDQQPDAEVIIERYTVLQISKATLLSALRGGGWADAIKTERTIRLEGTDLATGQRFPLR